MEHLYKEETPEGEVIMYCTPWCPDCRRARIWFRKNKINFSEVDISVNLSAARQVRSWGDGSQITPTFDINGEIILDYDERRLKDVLIDRKIS
jgi:glutaredoxin